MAKKMERVKELEEHQKFIAEKVDDFAKTGDKNLHSELLRRAKRIRELEKELSEAN